MVEKTSQGSREANSTIVPAGLPRGDDISWSISPSSGVAHVNISDGGWCNEDLLLDKEGLRYLPD